MMREWVFGIDVGGTRTKAGLVHLPSGQVKAARVFATEKHDEAAFWQAIKSTLHGLAAECSLEPAEIAGVGLGIGSYVYEDGGRLDSMCGFIDFLDGVQVGTKIQQLTGYPCIVDNDVRAIALAECTYGAAKNAGRVLTLTLGTGVGVCYTENGELCGDEANHHLAGHIMVRGRDEWVYALDKDGCYCAVYGCLESTCSGTALEKLAGEWVAPGTDNITLMRMATAGSPKAKQCLDFYFDCLMRGLNQLVYMFAPNLIVLGGGLAKDFPPYLGWLNEQLRAKVHGSHSPRIALASLNENSGILGAALLFKQKMLSTCEEVTP